MLDPVTCKQDIDQSVTEEFEEISIVVSFYSWFGTNFKGPGVLYSFFAGSLSDDYGRQGLKIWQNYCSNYLSQWWLEFDLTWLLINRFRN